MTVSFPKIPEDWTPEGWRRRELANSTPIEERTDEQWELLDRTAVWSDAAPDPEGDDSTLYSWGAGDAIDPA
ncbi:MAG: hypothetical protein JWO82_630 [Akkermansiaceae bacterium]|nr:hypothetical protein [Akkermansiaceae bacterium]